MNNTDNTKLVSELRQLCKDDGGCDGVCIYSRAANLIERHASDTGEAVAWVDPKELAEVTNVPRGGFVVSTAVLCSRKHGELTTALYTHAASDVQLTLTRCYGWIIAEVWRGDDLVASDSLQAIGVTADGGELAETLMNDANWLAQNAELTTEFHNIFMHLRQAASALQEMRQQ